MRPAVLTALALAACSEAPARPDPAPDPRACNRLIEESAKEGLIRARPRMDTVEVEEALWRAISARSKRMVAVLVRCSARNGEPNTEAVTGYVYGYRTGTMLAFASDVTTSLTD